MGNRNAGMESERNELHNLQITNTWEEWNNQQRKTE